MVRRPVESSTRAGDDAHGVSPRGYKRQSLNIDGGSEDAKSSNTGKDHGVGEGKGVEGGGEGHTGRIKPSRS